MDVKKLHRKKETRAQRLKKEQKRWKKRSKKSNKQRSLKRLKNRSKARRQARERYHNNPEPTLAYQKEYYKKNRKRIIKRVRAYEKKNRRKVSMRHNKAAQKKRKELKEEVYTHYSRGKPRCVCCGISGIEFLNTDHIKGRKNMERDKKLRKLGYSQKLKGDHLIVWLKNNNFPRGFQILCWNCNYGKLIEGKCPHKIKNFWQTRLLA